MGKVYLVRGHTTEGTSAEGDGSELSLWNEALLYLSF